MMESPCDRALYNELRSGAGFAGPALLICYTSAMRRHEFEAFFREQWERLGFGPLRQPRVTDDGEDDGLAGAPVPRKPIVPKISGGAALAIPLEDHGDVTAIANSL